MAKLAERTITSYEIKCTAQKFQFDYEDKLLTKLEKNEPELASSQEDEREKQCRVSEIPVNMKYLLVCSVVALLVLTSRSSNFNDSSDRKKRSPQDNQEGPPHGPPHGPHGPPPPGPPPSGPPPSEDVMNSVSTAMPSLASGSSGFVTGRNVNRGRRAAQNGGDNGQNGGGGMPGIPGMPDIPGMGGMGDMGGGMGFGFSMGANGGARAGAGGGGGGQPDSPIPDFIIVLYLSEIEKCLETFEAIYYQSQKLKNVADMYLANFKHLERLFIQIKFIQILKKNTLLRQDDTNGRLAEAFTVEMRHMQSKDPTPETDPHPSGRKSWVLPQSASEYNMGTGVPVGVTGPGGRWVAGNVPASASLYSMASGSSSISGVSSVSSTSSSSASSTGSSNLGKSTRVRQPSGATLRRSQTQSMKMRIQEYQDPVQQIAEEEEVMRENRDRRLPPIKEFQRDYRAGKASTRIRCAQKIVTQLETSPSPRDSSNVTSSSSSSAKSTSKRPQSAPKLSVVQEIQKSKKEKEREKEREKAEKARQKEEEKAEKTRQKEAKKLAKEEKKRAKKEAKARRKEAEEALLREEKIVENRSHRSNKRAKERYETLEIVGHFSGLTEHTDPRPIFRLCFTDNTLRKCSLIRSYESTLRHIHGEKRYEATICWWTTDITYFRSYLD
ncbi:hypothetical protein WN51_02845 [Melipona quadrifasciata]|uniref:Uncharacterized protein n=1 Tax=Melipona quadrifasciata TaxID=166423 RepID=A0A0M9AB67_9HYME|nr:hypothetical protein WN51_02845 [Melipona quadrifasciata]